ncbi:MAG: TauD/TfdA family dioxygenase [Candidatus Puniceispirillum sp.]|nr:TauD/TfdA family dioxygenase [Candidatus Puniceispirillum sp.]MBL6775149.1 TauD/TfdA family dioxygenase [Candidatus Puniceispirillum sp.]
MSANNQFEVIPTGAALGADIVGLDLTQEIDSSVFKKVISAWDEHLVLRFRNQNLTEDQFVRFSQYFGALDKAPTRPVNGAYHPTREEIAVISNIVREGVAIGGLGNSELVWHQDMTYKELPPKASILYGLTTPATGGDTHFYNLNRAYETLPDALRKQIKGLLCKHDATRNSAGQLRAGFDETYSNENRPGAVHPLVIKHHETGKESLYVGRRPNAWIVGLSDHDSDQLLDEIWHHIETGTHHWTQQWQPYDLVIWDNRYTLHMRGDLDPNQDRLMHRTQIRDERAPIAA